MKSKAFVNMAVGLIIASSSVNAQDIITDGGNVYYCKDYDLTLSLDYVMTYSTARTWQDLADEFKQTHQCDFAKKGVVLHDAWKGTGKIEFVYIDSAPDVKFPVIYFKD